MRKFLLAICAVCALGVNAQEKKLVLTEYYSWSLDYTSGDSVWQKTSANPSLYDAANNNTVQYNDYGLNLYTYANGLKTVSDYYSYSNGLLALSPASCQTYTYDAEGHLIKAVTLDGNYEYEYGGYIDAENYSTYASIYKGEPSYVYNYKYTFNEAGKIATRAQIMKPGEEGEYINTYSVYSYNELGQISKIVSGTYTVDETAEEGFTIQSPTVNEYTYNVDGTMATMTSVSESRWGTYKNMTKYIYAEVAAKYVPQNVKAVSNIGNTVTLTWDAVEGATSYKVLVDCIAKDVEGTTFTTDVIADGEHMFFVQAVIDGVARNICDVVKASVKDEGNIPATDFAIGRIAAVPTDWGSTNYAVEFTWKMPAGCSEVQEHGFVLDYGVSEWGYAQQKDLSQQYNLYEDYWPTVDENGNGSTIVMFYESDLAVWDNDESAYVGVVKPFSIIVNYVSGLSQKSNVVEANIIELYNQAEGVEANDAEEATIVSYTTISGIEVANPTEGIFVAKYSDGTTKVVRK